MKLVIAGPRDLHVSIEDIMHGYNCLDVAMMSKELDFGDLSEVVEGGSTGIDQCAREWHESFGDEPTTFEADWNKHGKAGGPIRNREMAEYSDALLVIKRKGVESRGTKSMINEAKKAGIPYYIKEVQDVEY